MEMTYEEVYKQFTNLIWSRVRKWDYTYQYDDLFDYEDLHQLAMIGLWKAYLNYDCSTGILFITYATKWIDGQILIHHRARNRKLKKKGSQFKGFVSLNYANDECENPTELQDLIADDKNYIEELIMGIELREAMETLTIEEREFIEERYFMDLSQIEIADRHNTYQAKVYRRIQSGLKKLRVLMAAQEAVA